MGSYVRPEEVKSPKQRWSLIKVLHDGGAEEYSIALGLWDNAPVLGMRWNGGEGSPIGNPQSRGLPTWFIVPENYRESIMEPLSKDMIAFIRKVFDK